MTLSSSEDLNPLYHPWWNSRMSSETNVYCLALFTATVTTFVGIAGVASWELTGSSLMLGFGMINIVELMRNLILMWRFSRPTGDSVEKILTRDDKSSILITFIMLCVGIGILIICIVDFVRGYEPINVSYLLSISIPATIFFGFLGYIKVRYARSLKSSALALDGLSSSLFSMFSFMMLVSTLLILKNPGAWWLDPVVALIMAFTCIVICSEVLYANIVVMGIPCFTLAYWASDTYEYERTCNFEFSTIEVFGA